MINKLHGQPDSYDRKCVKLDHIQQPSADYPLSRSRYRFGRTLGAGTYGIVREADCADGKVAVKIILKKNVKGNETMVYDELRMLQEMRHPHIVRFHDWFESRDKYYIVTQLATGGELFDRICEQGRFTEKDASQTIRQVLEAVHYLHENNVVHRDLKPENLLYLTSASDSQLVLADFGIAKMLVSHDEVLTTMAGSFGYAAPEVMLKKGHGKPVDMWSLGVITYTLLCGYSPFRSESIPALIDECKHGGIVFHERYWKDVSQDAKDFITTLLQPSPQARATSEEALRHVWLSGKNATDHNLLPEIRAYMAKARLRRGVELVKLSNRIEALKMQEDEDENVPGEADIPAHVGEVTGTALSSFGGPRAKGIKTTEEVRGNTTGKKRSLSRLARGAIFREIVLAKVREMKEQEEREKIQKDAAAKATQHSP
ncbi:MAG: hypothetical protein M1833_002510 [Piccolia ochrophora]|nr:MAG: hypothetical protein M1833_002510 [Piccolia ochrophora]